MELYKHGGGKLADSREVLAGLDSLDKSKIHGTEMRLRDNIVMKEIEGKEARMELEFDAVDRRTLLYAMRRAARGKTNMRPRTKETVVAMLEEHDLLRRWHQRLFSRLVHREPAGPAETSQAELNV